jgi:hypothetical protein
MLEFLILNESLLNFINYLHLRGHAVAWLRHYATSWKVASLSPG